MDNTTISQNAGEAEPGRATASHDGSGWPCKKWLLAGGGLLACHLVLAALSPRFDYTRDWGAPAIFVLVGVEGLAGLLYWLAVRDVRDTSHPRLMLWILAVGAGLRVSLFLATPMIADDHYRFLWDGAVLSHGMNPYAYAPGEVLAETEAEDSDTLPPALSKLAQEAGPVLARTNHPHLRSIYPPTAQAAFALAYGLHPWSDRAWRLVLCLFDLATFGLLLAFLRTLRLPLWYVAIYWWNPLLVQETFNAGHMDVVALPFVLAALLLAIRRRPGWAALSLALAAGAKVWPVVLLPLILRPVFTAPKRLLPALGLFGLLSGALFWPISAAGLDPSAGFTAYSSHWEMNDALFMLLGWVVPLFLKGVGAAVGYNPVVTRSLVLALLTVWILVVVRRAVRDPVDLCERGLGIVAAVFLLSPTQFPWYFLWLLPFLVVRPRPSLLLLTALLPLYYLRFYWSARDQAQIFDQGIVWLEFVPVWGLLLREWYRGHPRRSALSREVVA